MSKLYIGGTPISAVYMGGKRYGVEIGYERKPSSLVYELGETTFDGTKYIDTGIDLSQYEQYTVCLDAQYGDANNIQNMVDWMTENRPYPGWALDLYDGMRLAVKSPIKIVASNTTDRMRYVIRYDGSVYTLFAINAPNGLNVTNNIATGAINHTLLVGAYYNNGSINRYVHNGSKIWSFQVYSTALSDQECVNYYENGVVS